MAAKSDDPVEQQRLRRDRRRLAAIWIAATVIWVVLVVTGIVAVTH